MNSWIGFDLDGTLAVYDHWRGVDHVGDPIEPMVARVKAYLQSGWDVRIYTARVCREGDEKAPAEQAIRAWSLKHIGVLLPITNVKDFGMVFCYDDRAIQVEKNTGKIIGVEL